MVCGNSTDPSATVVTFTPVGAFSLVGVSAEFRYLGRNVGQLQSLSSTLVGAL